MSSLIHKYKKRRESNHKHEDHSTDGSFTPESFTSPNSGSKQAGSNFTSPMNPAEDFNKTRQKFQESGKNAATDTMNKLSSPFLESPNPGNGGNQRSPQMGSAQPPTSKGVPVPPRDSEHGLSSGFGNSGKSNMANLDQPPVIDNSSATPWSEYRIQNAAPSPRFGHSANYIAARDGELFILGGIRDVDILNDLWVIDTNTLTGHQLSTEGAKVGPRVGHASLVIGNAHVLFGGDTKIEESDPLDDNLYLLNTSSHKWTVALPVGARPCGRYGHSLSNIGPRVYLFGGQVDEEFYDDMWSFDLTSWKSPTCRWERIYPVTPPPPPRTNHTVITYNDKLYLFGGANGDLWYSDTWRFDPASRQWEQLECSGFVPSPCQGHAATVIGDTMYVFGGMSSQGILIDQLYALKLTTLKWYTFQNLGPGPSPRSGHSLTAFDNEKILVWGGTKEENSAYVLDVSRITYPSESSDDYEAAGSYSNPRNANESYPNSPMAIAPRAGNNSVEDIKHTTLPQVQEDTVPDQSNLNVNTNDPNFPTQAKINANARNSMLFAKRRSVIMPLSPPDAHDNAGHMPSQQHLSSSSLNRGLSEMGPKSDAFGDIPSEKSSQTDLRSENNVSNTDLNFRTPKLDDPGLGEKFEVPEAEADLKSDPEPEFEKSAQESNSLSSEDKNSHGLRRSHPHKNLSLQNMSGSLDDLTRDAIAEKENEHADEASDKPADEKSAAESIKSGATSASEKVTETPALPTDQNTSSFSEDPRNSFTKTPKSILDKDQAADISSDIEAEQNTVEYGVPSSPVKTSSPNTSILPQTAPLSAAAESKKLSDDEDEDAAEEKAEANAEDKADEKQKSDREKETAASSNEPATTASEKLPEHETDAMAANTAATTAGAAAIAAGAAGIGGAVQKSTSSKSLDKEVSNKSSEEPDTKIPERPKSPVGSSLYSGSSSNVNSSSSTPAATPAATTPRAATPESRNKSVESVNRSIPTSASSKSIAQSIPQPSVPLNTNEVPKSVLEELAILRKQLDYYRQRDFDQERHTVEEARIRSENEVVQLKDINAQLTRKNTTLTAQASEFKQKHEHLQSVMDTHMETLNSHQKSLEEAHKTIEEQKEQVNRAIVLQGEVNDLKVKLRTAESAQKHAEEQLDALNNSYASLKSAHSDLSAKHLATATGVQNQTRSLNGADPKDEDPNETQMSKLLTLWTNFKTTDEPRSASEENDGYRELYENQKSAAEAAQTKLENAMKEQNRLREELRQLSTEHAAAATKADLDVLNAKHEKVVKDLEIQRKNAVEKSDNNAKEIESLQEKLKSLEGNLTKVNEEYRNALALTHRQNDALAKTQEELQTSRYHVHRLEEQLQDASIHNSQHMDQSNAGDVSQQSVNSSRNDQATLIIRDLRAQIVILNEEINEQREQILKLKKAALTNAQK